MRSLLLLAYSFAATACITAPSSHPHGATGGKTDSHSHHGDPPAVHGMAAFGESTVFLSHLPMFHSPHDYQVILQASLDDDARRDRAALHTIAPRAFELADVREPAFAMTIDLFAGHFERGGTRLIRTMANVDRVVHFRKLSPTTPRPEAPSYLLFGDGNETYAVHLITTRPDFDQILKVNVVPVGGGGPQIAGAAGEPVELALHDRPPTEPLVAGETVTGTTPAGDTVAFDVEHEVYLEHGDLAF